MSDKKSLSNNATFAAIASGIVLAVTGAIAGYTGVTVASAVTWLRAAGAFWAADVTLSRWAYWLWVISSATAYSLVALRVYYAATYSESVVSAKTKPAPFAAYTSDTFLGLKWRWTISATGRVSDIEMYCPTCDYELSGADFKQRMTGEYLCKCVHCNYKTDIADFSVHHLLARVKKTAEQKIRTGEWQKAR